MTPAPVKTRLVLSFIAMLVVPIVLISVVFNLGIAFFRNAHAIPTRSASLSVGLTFNNQNGDGMRHSLLQTALFHKDELFERIWGWDSLGDLATLTVHIRKIREKIESDPSNPQYIQTIWGVGYRFEG